MARKVIPLSDSDIKRLKPKDKLYRIPDGNGLFIKILPTASKIFEFRYLKPLTKKANTITLGKYPALTLANARLQCSELRQMLVNGIDPKVSNNKKTFFDVAQRWLKIKQSFVTESYLNDIISILNRFVFPNIGNIEIEKITPSLILSLLSPIEAANKSETVRRTSQRINEILNHAVFEGFIAFNPCLLIHKTFKKQEKKNMPTIRPEELKDFLAALMKSNSKIKTRCAVLFQLHTMTRPNESTRAEWQEFDFEKRVWKIPASKMKKGREHIIPLSKQAITILNYMKKISLNNKYVFCGDRNINNHMNTQTPNDLIKNIGYKGILVAHGLRSIASTTLNEHGFNPDWIETALAHVSDNQVRAAYNRSLYIDQRKEMMQWWSDFIDQQYLIVF